MPERAPQPALWPQALPALPDHLAALHPTALTANYLTLYLCVLPVAACALSQYTPVDVAAGVGDIDMVLLLRSYGADCEDSYDIAVKRGHTVLASRLLAEGNASST